MEYTKGAIDRLKERLSDTAMRDSTPSKYAALALESLEVIKLLEKGSHGMKFKDTESFKEIIEDINMSISDNCEHEEYISGLRAAKDIVMECAEDDI